MIADRFLQRAARRPDWDLRVFALSRASERLLKACGVWDSLPAKRVFAYERMCVWDASGAPQGAGSLCFDCAQIGEPNLGYIVEGRALAMAVPASGEGRGRRVHRVGARVGPV